MVEPAKGYGIYQPRKDNVYLVASPERPVFPGKGQPMYVYLEPTGYGVKDLTDGRWEISFAMDVELFDGQGKHLYSKKDFMRVQSVSRRFKARVFHQRNHRPEGRAHRGLQPAPHPQGYGERATSRGLPAGEVGHGPAGPEIKGATPRRRTLKWTQTLKPCPWRDRPTPARRGGNRGAAND